MIYLGIVMTMFVFLMINIIKEDKYMKNEMYYFFGFSVIIFFLAAFRNGIGYDYNNYLNIFNLIKNNIPLEQHGMSVEIGYDIINRISPNFMVVIFICAIIGVIPKLVIIKQYSKEKILTLLMYFTSILIMYDMGVIRQGMAISMAFISIKFILEKNIYKFLLTIGIGTLFHVSVLLFIPIYFIGSMKISKKNIYIITGVVCLFSIFNISNEIVKLVEIIDIPIISEKIVFYANSNSANITLPLLKRVAILIVFVEAYERLRITDKESILFLNGYFLSIIIMSLFSSIEVLGARGSMTLYCLQIFVFAAIYNKIKIKKIKVALLLVIMALFTNSMMGPIKDGNQSNQPYTPYKTIFTKRN